MGWPFLFCLERCSDHFQTQILFVIFRVLMESIIIIFIGTTEGMCHGKRLEFVTKDLMSIILYKRIKMLSHPTGFLKKVSFPSPVSAHT